MVTGSADETGGGARRAPGFGSASRTHCLKNLQKLLQNFLKTYKIIAKLSYNLQKLS